MKSMCLGSRNLPLAVLLLLTSLPSVFAGGSSCKKCGCEKEVKPCLRLVKVCEEIELPEYACLKQEVYFPEKGSICYEGYRCDTYYKIWRDCVCNSKGKGDLPLIQDPLQTSPKKPLPPLNCTCYTESGWKKMFGAIPAGCHEGCSIRTRVAVPKVVVPVFKWETVHLCKDCKK